MTESVVIDKSERRSWLVAVVALLPAALGTYWVYGAATDSWGYGILGVFTGGALGLAALGCAIAMLRRAFARPVPGAVVIDATGIRWTSADRVAWSMAWTEIAGVRLTRQPRAHARPTGPIETYQFTVLLNSAAFRKRHTKLKGAWRGGHALSYTVEATLSETEAQEVRQAAERLGRVEVHGEDVPRPKRPSETPAVAVSSPVEPATAWTESRVETSARSIVVRPDAVAPRRAAMVGAAFAGVALIALALTRIVPQVPVQLFAGITAAAVMGVFGTTLWYLGWNQKESLRSKVTLTEDRFQWYGSWKPRWWTGEQAEFGVRWPELREVRLVTVRSGRKAVRVVELVPGDQEFAGRHPEMEFLRRARIKVGSSLLPHSDGAFRLPDKFSPAGAARLAEAVETVRPGMLRRLPA
ncbi:hypothetical protein [Amycolatopsis anabasis]|uniref:hypothetical protein n=1 Tax=Amycolatopsis anabasis TaxID=1840409 RepID=UPI00131EC21E|nr:hypothetical protein [Amycolatopsis anabasis]